MTRPTDNYTAPSGRVYKHLKVTAGMKWVEIFGALLDGIDNIIGEVVGAMEDSIARAGATGGGDDRVFALTDQAVTASYTIPAGRSAMTAGPVSIADGVTITVPTGSAWAII